MSDDTSSPNSISHQGPSKETSSRSPQHKSNLSVQQSSTTTSTTTSFSHVEKCNLLTTRTESKDTDKHVSPDTLNTTTVWTEDERVPYDDDDGDEIDRRLVIDEGEDLDNSKKDKKDQQIDSCNNNSNDGRTSSAEVQEADSVEEDQENDNSFEELEQEPLTDSDSSDYHQQRISVQFEREDFEGSEVERDYEGYEVEQFEEDIVEEEEEVGELKEDPRETSPFDEGDEEENNYSIDVSDNSYDDNSCQISQSLSVTSDEVRACTNYQEALPTKEADLFAVALSSHTPFSTRSKDWICKGAHVLARWKDGLFYTGVILKVDLVSTTGRALVEYEDGSQYWTDFKDLHKQGGMDEGSDILCVVCSDGTSQSPNEIVICDVCNQGYHQQCHKPKIPPSILEPNVPWSCRLCVFALGTKAGPKPSSSLSKQLKWVKGELPYPLESLAWDEDHRVNIQNTYCYCGGPGDYYSKMLQCRKCLQWFHEACIGILDRPLLYGDHYFTFTCQICNKDEGGESLKRIIMKWSDFISLVIHNLYLQRGRKYFDLDKEIISFIRTHAGLVKLSEDITKLSLQDLKDRVSFVLHEHTNKFVCGKEVKKGSNTWALKSGSSHPQIFAPPNAITSRKCPVILEPTCITPSMIFPYGACRKGASVVPTSARNAGVLSAIKMQQGSKDSKKKKSPLGSPSSKTNKVQKSSNGNNNLSRSGSVASLSNNSLTSSSGSSSGRVQEKKTPKKTTTFPPALSCKTPRKVYDSLEAMIPVPLDLHGKDNPFLYEDGDLKVRGVPSPVSKRKEPPVSDQDEETYRVVKKSPSRLTIQRINLPSSTTTNSNSCRRSLNDLLGGTASKDGSGKRYNVIARRVTADGKVEVLLEEEIR